MRIRLSDFKMVKVIVFIWLAAGFYFYFFWGNRVSLFGDILLFGSLGLLYILIKHIYWRILIFDTTQRIMLISQYLLWHRFSTYKIPFKKATFIIEPIYESAVIDTAVISDPGLANRCDLVLTDSVMRFYLYRSARKNYLKKKIAKIQTFINETVNVVDEQAEALAMQERGLWKHKNAENIIATFVITGFSLIFIGGCIASFYKKVFIFLLILGSIVVISGLVYGVVVRGEKQK